VAVLDLVAPLERFYGPLPTPPTDLFRYYVWEALSTQTTPARRDAAYAALHRVPALTPDSIFRAPRGKLTEAVACAGPYASQRLHALLAGAEHFRRRPRLGELARGALWPARRALAALPRVGDAGVHRLLLFGGDHRIMPVDRDIVRLCVRLGIDSGTLHPTGAARRVRRAVERALPDDVVAFKRTALYLRHHAAQTCTHEPHCHVCPIATHCPAAPGGSEDPPLRAAPGRS